MEQNRDPKVRSPKKWTPNSKETLQSCKEGNDLFYKKDEIKLVVLETRVLKLNPCPTLCSMTNSGVLDLNMKSGILKLLEYREILFKK